MTAVGERVRVARTKKGLTIAALAEACGLSRPFLSQVETGKRQPSVAHLATLAAALGVPASYLLGRPVPGTVLLRAGEVQDFDPRSLFPLIEGEDLTTALLAELDGTSVFLSRCSTFYGPPEPLHIVVHVLTGSGTWWVGDQEPVDLHPGDTYSYSGLGGVRIQAHGGICTHLAVAHAL